MDLRSYKVPPNISALLERQSATMRWYQPFVFSDDVVTGFAAVWNGGADKLICTEADPPELRADFLGEALILGNWYNHLVDIIVAAFPNAQTFLDFGCNVGHFCFDLASRGKSCTGIDHPLYELGVSLLKDMTGLDFEFIGTAYTERSHQLGSFDETRRFDGGVLSAVLMHLTDPHYAMPYFASKFTQGFFFSSALVPGGGHFFHARIRGVNRHKPLPDTFELIPTAPLAENLIRLSGFACIYRIPYRDGIDPRNSKKWGCWIAAREPIPESAISAFNLSLCEDRIDDFADTPRPWEADVPVLELRRD